MMTMMVRGKISKSAQSLHHTHGIHPLLRQGTFRLAFRGGLYIRRRVRRRERCVYIAAEKWASGQRGRKEEGQPGMWLHHSNKGLTLRHTHTHTRPQRRGKEQQQPVRYDNGGSNSDQVRLVSPFDQAGHSF